MAGSSIGGDAGARRESTPARPRVPSEQRLFSLVLALVVSPNGTTKRELLSSVYGYADRYDHGPISPALEKLFERDKEQLRALGIAIDAFDDPSAPGNNHLTRYRISKEVLQFPADLQFSERELMLLRLAALAWSEGSLSAESRRAVMKLEALGAGLDVQHLGVAPRLGSVEPAAGPLQQAIDAQRAVAFAYRLPDRGAPLDRRVAPLRLHRAEGRWHLISWDLDRHALRTFLLARIEGAVRQLLEPVDPALADLVDGAVADLECLRAERRARLRVQCGSIAEARLTSRADHVRAAQATGPAGASVGAGAMESHGARSADGAPEASDPSGAHAEIELGVLDLHLLAAELIGYGSEVSVLAPPDLRDLVTQGLQRIADAHGVAAPAARSAVKGGRDA